MEPKIQQIILLTVAVVLLTTTPGDSAAAWLVDPVQFHMSPHGQLSCQDCHADVAERSLHPDPRAVSRSQFSFFSADTCYDCHEETKDRFKEREHGGKVVADVQAYRLCITCHNPHAQNLRGATIDAADEDLAAGGLCGGCHEARTAIPSFSVEDNSCMACHRQPNPAEPEFRHEANAMCLQCHGRADSQAAGLTQKRIALIDPEDFQKTTHAEFSCLDCHRRAAAFDHANQPAASCDRCHSPHGAREAHDAHINVTCGACHLSGVLPVKAQPSGKIVYSRVDDPKATLTIHKMAPPDKPDSCRRCHFSSNPLGAAAVVLPAKGIFCMPCHAATFSITDIPSIMGSLVFFIGLGGMVLVWFSGGDQSHLALKNAAFDKNRQACRRSTQLYPTLKTIVLDMLLQRRLYRYSPTRWLIHSLIFFPLMLRLLWGLFTVALLHGLVGETVIQAMLNKNHPLTALFFDATGLLMLTGLITAICRHWRCQSGLRLPHLPSGNPLLLGLIALLIGVGFITEGMRIAMTGCPPGAEFAFVGNALAELLRHAGALTDIYGFLWYAHAILTALVIAYLPFSRLFHVISAPVVLVLNSGRNTRPDRA